MDAQQKNILTYKSFAAAWGAKDVDRLMELVTDDIVYGASVGPEPGTTYRGRDEVKKGFTEILAYDRALGARTGPLMFADGRLFVEWSYDTVNSGGEKQVTRGIDIIEFRDGLISLKEAFRKAPAQAKS